MTSTERLHPELHAVPAPAGAFRSILFPGGEEPPEGVPRPACFTDLNLDQVVDEIVAGRDDYDLTPFFHLPLRDVDTVVYRQQVFQDLEDESVDAAVRAFAEEMRRSRSYLTLSRTQHYAAAKRRWFLDAAAAYRHAVDTLAAALAQLELRSSGLRSLRDYLGGYTASQPFRQLAADADHVLRGLDALRYTLRIKGSRVTVSGYHDEADYTVEVEDTFARFREHDASSHLMKVPDPGSMDHVEARIAELLARLEPAPFRALDEFCAEHAVFVDERVARFDREAQFYLAYLDHRARLTRNGFALCHPDVSTTDKEIAVEGGYDLALAGKLMPEGGGAVVRNDFHLAGSERILVVTGPNQGGKTTFARMFGQLHYLASLGLPVPARSARLFLPDQVFAHFEQEEDIATLRGKLEDELVRMRDILEHASAESVVVINEIFASTTLGDAVELGERMLRRLIELDCVAVCVTFVDELATLGPETVSMVATVEADDPSRRTFTIVRRAADGRAYAWAIAEKYGISYERLKARLGG
jgi:hypothetical protein